LKAKATAVGADTMLSAIIRLVDNAQNSKAPIQRLADTVSSYFVPAVLIVSACTLLIWWAIGFPGHGVINAVAVLIIACPCALGLATPTVILVATGLGAERGLLYKDASAIERAEKLQTIIFDKTGTLTEGNPRVTDVYPFGGVDEFKVLKIAMILENNSQHPIATSIVKHGASKGLKSGPLTSFQFVSGKGVVGEIEGTKYYVGSPAFAEEMQQDISQEQVKKFEMEGKTVCLVWSQYALLGVIAVMDPLRKNSTEAVHRLHRMGIHTVMMTGDNKQTAKAIASQVGIEHYEAEVLPDKKAEKVKELMKAGRVVGMVGDGINDAPALAAADVGFAISTGSDIAIEAADITLVRDDLLGVIKAIELSKASFHKIRQNLFFAFIYNILGIPLAALGILNPMIAAAAMALSSVSVVGNALLLKKMKR